MGKINQIVIYLLILSSFSANAVERYHEFLLDTSEYSWDSESEILVVSVSHEGRSVWQLELDEIAKIRAEIFDPSTGEIIQNANRVNSEIRNQYKIYLLIVQM